MNEKQKPFKPDTIDSQLDELLHLPHSSHTDPEAQTVQAVEQVYKSQALEEIASLDRVSKRFMRLAAYKQASVEKKPEHALVQDGRHQEMDTTTTTIVTNLGSIQNSQLPGRQPISSSARRVIALVAAILALALVSGSVISFLLIAEARVAHTPKRNITHPIVQPKTTAIHHIVPTTTPAPIPQTQITCPAMGTSRVAILPAIAQKVGQSIIYASTKVNNQSDQNHLLEHYNVVTGQTTSLLSLDTSNMNSDTMYIRAANLSADGQWMVLVVSPQSIQSSVPSMIQLLRTDGQYRQTLYCGSTGQVVDHARLSPDMKSLVFDLNPPGIGSPRVTGLYLLDLVNGGPIHTLLTQQPGAEIGLIYEPETWIDNNHVLVNMFGSLYVKDAQGVYDNAPGKIMSLDITQGDNQQIAQLPILLDQTNDCQKFDISPDRSFLVTTQCQRQVVNTSAGWHNTGTLIVKNIASGTTQTILSRNDLPVQSVHMVSNTTILFTVLANSSQSTNNGLWSINTDGTGLTQLVSVSGAIPSYIDLSQGWYGQPSAYISNDKSLYIVVERGQGASINGPMLQLNYMPSSGGNLVTVQSSGQITSVLGWTAY